MSKPSAIDRAIQSFDDEIRLLQLARERLIAQRDAKPVKPRIGRQLRAVAETKSPA